MVDDCLMLLGKSGRRSGTVAALADAKKVPVEELRGYGQSDARHHGAAEVRTVCRVGTWVMLFVPFV